MFGVFREIIKFWEIKYKLITIKEKISIGGEINWNNIVLKNNFFI